jgi:hypothetical protein
MRKYLIWAALPLVLGVSAPVKAQSVHAQDISITKGRLSVDDWKAVGQKQQLSTIRKTRNRVRLLSQKNARGDRLRDSPQPRAERDGLRQDDGVWCDRRRFGRLSPRWIHREGAGREGRMTINPQTV